MDANPQKNNNADGVNNVMDNKDEEDNDVIVTVFVT